jgi:hypothetical protein
MSVSWVLTPCTCRQIVKFRRNKLSQSSALKIITICISETSVSTRKSTRRYNAETAAAAGGHWVSSPKHAMQHRPGPAQSTARPPGGPSACRATWRPQFAVRTQRTTARTCVRLHASRWTRRFSARPPTACHWTPPWVKSIHSTPCSLKIHFNIILPPTPKPSEFCPSPAWFFL